MSRNSIKTIEQLIALQTSLKQRIKDLKEQAAEKNRQSSVQETEFAQGLYRGYADAFSLAAQWLEESLTAHERITRQSKTDAERDAEDQSAADKDNDITGYYTGT